MLTVLAVALVCIAWGVRSGRRRRPRRGRGRRWRVSHSTVLLERLRGVGSAGQVFAYLRKIDPFIFEELVLTCFEERGIAVTRNRRYTGDGGSDGQIWLGGERMHVQAKRYGKHINRPHVAEFLQLVARRQMKGVFVHTGRTGKGARAAAGSSEYKEGWFMSRVSRPNVSSLSASVRARIEKEQSEIEATMREALGKLEARLNRVVNAAGNNIERNIRRALSQDSIFKDEATLHARVLQFERASGALDRASAAFE